MTSAPLESQNPESQSLSDRDFQRLADFIQNRSGIKLPPSKKILVEGRIRRRMRQLRLDTFSAYCKYLFESSHSEDEEDEILDVITTNKTDFFREIHHFRYLAEKALPDLASRGRGTTQALRVWSAGCSNGAEPYSIAMVCQAFAEQHPGFRYGVIGSDLSTAMLRVAQRAIYPHDMIEPLPMEWRKRYLLRSQSADGDGAGDEIRIAPEVRRAVTFGHVNLMSETYPIEGQVEILFCRNVLIYFDKPTQGAVLSRLCRVLAEGGYLFLGHSESITGLPLPLRTVAPTVFVREASS